MWLGKKKRNDRGDLDEQARFAKPNPNLVFAALQRPHIHQLLTSVQPLLALAATAPLPFREAAQTCHAVTAVYKF